MVPRVFVLCAAWTLSGCGDVCGPWVDEDERLGLDQAAFDAWALDHEDPDVTPAEALCEDVCDDLLGYLESCQVLTPEGDEVYAAQCQTSRPPNPDCG